MKWKENKKFEINQFIGAGYNFKPINTFHIFPMVNLFMLTVFKEKIDYFLCLEVIDCLSRIGDRRSREI